MITGALSAGPVRMLTSDTASAGSATALRMHSIAKAPAANSLVNAIALALNENSGIARAGLILTSKSSCGLCDSLHSNKAGTLTRMTSPPKILVFDSGLGGLTVFREIIKARPDAQYFYLADDARFPYGRIPEGELIARVVDIVGSAIGAHTPDLVVIACNTASTLALKELRMQFKVPFIGTVPAIKPACAGSRSKMVSVLGTEATVAREYTMGLIREFAQGCDVKLVGSAWLAAFAEAELNGNPASDEAIATELAPCFIAQGERRTDTIALACTHYPLLGERLKKLAPWPVDWIDPAPAIARRVIDLIGAPSTQAAPLASIAFTSGRAPPPALATALRSYGFRA
jgi:glutamate racemase